MGDFQEDSRQQACVSERIVFENQAHHYFYPRDGEVNILEYWSTLRKRKWLVILGVLCSLMMAIVITLLLPRQYTSVVTLMSIQSNSIANNLGALSSQISDLPILGSQLGGLGNLGSEQSQDLVNILKSDSLTENVIQHFDLMPILFDFQWDNHNKQFKSYLFNFIPIPEIEDAIKKFKKKVALVEIDKKTNLITIEVTLKDSILAAQIANAMVVYLQDFINKNSLTVAKRNRIFTEEQLIKNRAQVLEGGKELNQFFVKNNISSTRPQLDVLVGSYEPLSKSFEEFRAQLEGLGLEKTENGKNKITTRVKEVPSQVYLEYLTMQYEMYSKANALLTQRYELAKIEEGKEDLAFQVLDKAKASVRPSSPNLLLNLLLAFLGGVFIFTFLAFFLDYLQKLKTKQGA
ncbi:MAG: hypothetical protein KDK66_04560 [Deltaproteobacteria bacterium]|nr:hypothetical protein [Deltaproteobacteria bacterium]